MCNLKNMRVDVVLLTKNTNKWYFPIVLKSLRENVNINKLIVVDGGSTDNTIETIERVMYNINTLFIFDVKGNRASSREIGIKLVETEWFLFIDSDVILCKNWLEYAEKHIDSKTGAIQGIDYPLDSIELKYYLEVEKIRRRLNKPHPRETRGFTGDTLIKTELVKDIKIPRFLHYYEDYFIKKWIEKKGFKWKVTSIPYSIHAYTRRVFDIRFYEASYIAHLVGYMNLKTPIKSTILMLPKLLTISIKCKNPLILIKHYPEQIYRLIGVLKAHFESSNIKEYINNYMR